MTSEERFSKVYVWTQIDGEPVIVGAFEPGDRLGTFYYADSYVERPDAYPLDPVNLPLVAKKDFHTQSNGGIFGVLLDAGPDSWGQRVLLSYSPSKPRTALEFLLAGNGEGVGSLLFSLSRSSVKRPALMGSAVDLETLERAAQQIEADQELPEPLREAMLAGSSLGGARPKAAVVIDGQPWMAKFSKQTDLFDEVVAEKACLEMAYQLGFEVPESRVVPLANGRNILLTRRFDFDEKGNKRHYISANSLLNLHRVSENRDDHGYPGLADKLRTLPGGLQLAKELYRRMVFRVLVGDTDDHGRNHGFLLIDGKYAQSPVFDVLPHLNTLHHQAMPIGWHGRERNIVNLVSLSERFGYTKDHARRIIGEQQLVLRQWPQFLAVAGASKKDIEVLTPCFAMVGTNPMEQIAKPKNDADRELGH